jgi:hypothetical protein
MFDVPALLEIEYRPLDVVAELEVEGRRDDFIVLAERAGGGLAGRKDTSDGAVKLLARVYLKMDALTRRDRWMLSFYPLGAAPLPFRNEDGHYSIWKPSLRRVEPLLGKGEQRFPRDSCGDAIQLALDNLADDIPKPELAAIRKVVGQLRPSFEHSSRGYAGRFRPPRDFGDRSVPRYNQVG